MRYAKYLILLMIFIGSLTIARAQFGVGIGTSVVVPNYYEPVCEWGYYPYAPYYCVPYGYYGPDWFIDGVFIGVGPWYGHRWHGRGYDGWYRQHYYWHERERWDRDHRRTVHPEPRFHNFGGEHGGRTRFHGGHR